MFEEMKWIGTRVAMRVKDDSFNVCKVTKGRKKVTFGDLCHFQQLRSYHDETETQKMGRNSKGSFSCRRTIDSPPSNYGMSNRPGFR